jgi:hypothetical protein
MIILVGIGILWLILWGWVKRLEKLILFNPSKREDCSFSVFSANGIAFSRWMIPVGKDQIDVAFFPREKASGTVLFCHGNSGNITNAARINNIYFFLEEGFQVVIFDYRGYGRSTGRPSETNLYQDARAVYQFVVERIAKREDLIFFGRSLGTGVAIELATQFEPKTLILEAAFCSTHSVIRTWFSPWFYVLAKIFLSNKFVSEKKIGQITAPILMFQGEKDEVIPIKNGQKLFSLAQKSRKKVFQVIPNGTHETSAFVDIDFYWEKLASFCSEI